MGIQYWDPAAPPRLDEFEILGWKKIQPGYTRCGIAMPFCAHPGGIVRKPKVVVKARYRWVWP